MLLFWRIFSVLFNVEEQKDIFLRFMAFDLWDSSYHQVTHEGNDSMLTGWQCDFHTGYGFDVIEEDALNEKSCVQVLRILIIKADTEIDELERDLVLLQSELACAEHKEWSELCFNALMEKINCLEISIRSLRNADENDIEVQLLMHTEPANRVHEILRSLLKSYFQENDEQAANTNVEDSSCDTLRLESGHYDRRQTLQTTAKDTMNHDLSLQLEKKRKCNPANLKVQPADATLEASSKDALLLGIGQSDKKIKSSSSSLKIPSMEIVEHNPTSRLNDTILGSPSKQKGKKTDHGKEVKPANAVVKSRSAEPLRPATGVNQMKRCSDAGLGASRQVESENSDLELKLSDFAVKNIRKEGIKGLRITPTVKIDASDSPAKTQYKRKNAPQKVKVQEAGFTKTGGSPTSLLDMRDQRGQEATKLQLIEEGTLEAEDVQKAEVAAVGAEPLLSFSLKPQKQKEKRMIEPDTPQVQDAAFPSIGVVSKSSLIPKSKSKQKSGLSSNIVILNQSLNGKVKKRLVKRGQYEVKEFSVAVMDSKSSVSESRKKGKRTSNLPTTSKIRDSTVPMDLPNFPNGSNENLQIIKSRAVSSHNKALAPLPYAVLNLREI